MLEIIYIYIYIGWKHRYTKMDSEKKKAKGRLAGRNRMKRSRPQWRNARQ